MRKAFQSLTPSARLGISRVRRAPASIARKETTRIQLFQRKLDLCAKGTPRVRPDAPVVMSGLPSVSRFSLEGSIHLAGRTDADAQLILDSLPHVVWTASADGVTMWLNPLVGSLIRVPAWLPRAMTGG